MAKKATYNDLFAEYLRVCNEVLAANKDCFPYDRIFHQIQFLMKCHVVQVFIYDEDEHHPEAMYDMVLKDDLLTAAPAHKPRAKNPWFLSKYFLEQVVRQPDTYIKNPAQLNWKWLTDHSVGI